VGGGKEMNLSPQQSTALSQIKCWLDKKNKAFFYLAGFAGTGKTTCATSFAEGVGGQVLYAAYTGKAASVMRARGCHNATTLHSLVYLPKMKCRQLLGELEDQHALVHAGSLVMSASEEQELVRRIAEERTNLARPSFSLNEGSELKNAALLVVDECSMCSEQMGKDLLSFGVPILALGDPFQLPPVRGEGFFTAGQPDYLLTDIHRQASDNPIIAMATTIREGRELELGKYGSSEVTNQIAPQEALQHDQVLVGRNQTRRDYNVKIRRLLGRTELVEVGDRVVCLRNNHEQGLMNGAVFTVNNVHPYDSTLGDGVDNSYVLGLTDDAGQMMSVNAHRDTFEAGGVPEGSGYFERQGAEEFCHAYALTCHKSQGSQWNSVLVMDESQAFGQNAARWLYTAATRASERLTILRK